MALGEPSQSTQGPPAGLPPAEDEEQKEDDDEDDDDDDDEDDDDCSDSCCGRPDGMDPEEEEKAHFLDVCYSLLDYRRDATCDVDRLKAGLGRLRPDEAKLWKGQPNPYLSEIQKRVEANAQFLALLPSPEVCGVQFESPDGREVHQIPPGHNVAERNASKARSTLRQFVRDWAEQGKDERAACYQPLIDALQARLPPRGGESPVAVLCPGCGLGRLPYDLARLGYAAQGNEFSYHMLLGSHLVLNRCTQALSFVTYPFVLCTTNRRTASDHLRAVAVPDVCPRATLPPDARLSMAAGEFIEVYKEQVGFWDAVLTCFFLDTAKNVLLYIRTIAQIIRPGGLWINIGPLLYHYADVEHEISIELSWEEVRPIISQYFKIVEEERRDCLYTTVPGSLMAVKYRCIFFVAERNDKAPSGHSNPVF